MFTCQTVINRLSIIDKYHRGFEEPDEKKSLTENQKLVKEE